MNLPDLLSEFEIDGRLGGVAFDRAYLRRALAEVGRQRAAAFWIAISVQVAVFATITGFVIAHAGDPKVIAYVLPAGSGGLAAAGWAAVRFWKEKVASDMLIALVSSMDEEAAKTALGVVLDMFRQNTTTAAGRAA